MSPESENGGPKLSRRDFLNPFRRFRTTSSTTGPGNFAVEKVGELGCLGLLAMLAMRGSGDRLATYDVNSESYIKDLKGGREKISVIDKFSDVLGDLDRKSDVLGSAWRRAYEEERSFQTCTTSDKGVITCTTYTYYVWNEPRELTQLGLNHQRISGWNDLLDKLPSKITGFRAEAPGAYDLKREASVLFYPRHEVDAGSSQILAFALYGLVGFVYMNYEEIIARLTRTEVSNSVVDDKKYIKRRTFLKLLASLTGYLGIRNVQDVFARDNEDLLGKIKEHARLVLTQKDIDPAENFKRYFGVTPMQIRQTLDDINSVSKAVLESGYSGRQVWGGDKKWGNVQSALTELLDQSTYSLGQFDNFFSVDQETGALRIPDNLTEITADIWATKQINDFVKAQTTTVNLRHPLNALFLALGLGGAALLTEAVLLPASDKILGEVVE